MMDSKVLKEQKSSRALSILNKNPIFIIGIMERSGTSFLLNLLKLYPECAPIRSPIYEDHFLRRADLLIRYADSLQKLWESHGKADENLMNIFYKNLGDGLISFLNQHSESDKISLTKTPGVENLRYFFKLFPSSHLLILIRDGRSVVESGVRTFHWNATVAMRKWAKSAKEILQFNQSNKCNEFKYLIVRYEDLCNNLEEELNRILYFLDLDSSKYDFDAARNLPVLGSSEISKDAKGNIHWVPVERPADFSPLDRWNHWSRPLHGRFNCIAAKYLKYFGYVPKKSSADIFLWPLWKMWNLLMEVKFLLRSLIKFVYLGLKRTFRPMK